jgi:hypothetical protein
VEGPAVDLEDEDLVVGGSYVVSIISRR